MAHIIFADKTGQYDGRDLERRPLGGTESSVIRCARALALRGHRVEVYSNCAASVLDHGVLWRPLTEPRPDSCDLYIACHQPELLGYVRNPRRRAIWVLWPVSQLRHYKKIWRSWWYRPIPILISLYQARTYSHLLPHRDPQFVLPHGLPDDIRGLPALASTPPPRAIFASNPQRNLRRLVEIWVHDILPKVPNAVLDVYGVHGIASHEDAWTAWGGSLLPEGLPPAVKASIVIHPSQSRTELADAMRHARVMLYLGHKAEAFCLAVAEAQALGVPAVVSSLTVLPERVIDQVTGFVRDSDTQFAEAAIALLTDDALWRRQHEAAIRHQQGIDWSEHAGRLESFLVGDMELVYRSVVSIPPMADAAALERSSADVCRS
jgi:glycosyltransferase involved in cell wall biosynthesis